MYIVIAIVLFGVLIAIHEFGHFIAAKSMGVKVNEFAIGMGPAILSKQGKETKYALRILPIGGFCALEGEDGDSEDTRAFSQKPIWKKIIILVAGSFMNFLLGIIIIFILFSGNKAFTTPILDGFMEGYQYEGSSGLLAEDRIVSIDGERVFTTRDVSLLLSRSNGKTVDLVIKRDGRKIQLDNFPMELQEFQTPEGAVKKYGLYFKTVEASVGQIAKNSWYDSISLVRMVRLSLSDLLTGAVGIKQMSGPVGIVSIINEVGESTESTSDGIRQVAYLCAFIAINLAVMNMLPIPALDGGRIFFILVTFIIEKIIRRKLNPKIEGYIHGTGLILLLALMAIVMYNDITRLI